MILMISLQLYELAIIFKFGCKYIRNIPKVLIWLAISAKNNSFDVIVLVYNFEQCSNQWVSFFNQLWPAKLNSKTIMTVPFKINYQVCITLSPCWRFEERVYFCFFVFLEFDGADWTKNSLELRVSYTSYIQETKKRFFN